MQNPTTQPSEELGESAPRYLNESFESHDHANQWDVAILWPEPKIQARSDEAE